MNKHHTQPDVPSTSFNERGWDKVRLIQFFPQILRSKAVAKLNNQEDNNLRVPLAKGF